MVPLSASIQSFIYQLLKQHFPRLGTLHFQPVSGGSINHSYHITDGLHHCFCKINSAQKFPQLFQKEANALAGIKQSGCLKVPEVYHVSEKDDDQFLLMEWIETGERTSKFWTSFGSGLAQLHSCHAAQFGWEENNYMGAVPQQNNKCDSWPVFFRDHRLQPLVKQCVNRHLLEEDHVKKFTSVYNRLPQIFGVLDKPSLLHGDLWSGNFICNRQNEPVLIDPAVYYGHPSVDLGMTTLFGGFHQRFYDAYRQAAAIAPNEREQWEIANLYPLLIHLLLFGKSYLSQIAYTLKKFQ